MGSNSNRHGDKKITSEWGSKSRKESYRDKHRAFDEKVIEGELDPRPTPGGKRRKKDTVKWCRGKEGREHDYELIEKDRGFSWWRWDEYRCKGCQKKKHERSA